MKFEYNKYGRLRIARLRFTNEDRGEFAVWHGEKVSLCLSLRFREPGQWSFAPIVLGLSGILHHNFYVKTKLIIAEVMFVVSVRRGRYR